MASSMNNCGKLREFLANMMLGVKNGDLDVNAARNIVKLAEKINENYYAELKVAQINMQLDRKVAELGKLPVGEA